MTLYDVEYDAIDPFLGTLDLNWFERLPEAERKRIIIRVLCGLVAMEEDEQAPAERTLAAVPDAGPTPGPSTTDLPVLGIERDGAYKRRTRPRGWNTALLPFFGHERAY
jgi:hypothetical protein